jgi:hypothetical protein
MAGNHVPSFIADAVKKTGDNEERQCHGLYGGWEGISAASGERAAPAYLTNMLSGLLRPNRIAI